MGFKDLQATVWEGQIVFGIILIDFDVENQINLRKENTNHKTFCVLVVQNGTKIREEITGGLGKTFDTTSNKTT